MDFDFQGWLPPTHNNNAEIERETIQSQQTGELPHRLHLSRNGFQRREQFRSELSKLLGALLFDPARPKSEWPQEVADRLLRSIENQYLELQNHQSNAHRRLPHPSDDRFVLFQLSFRESRQRVLVLNQQNALNTIDAREILHLLSLSDAHLEPQHSAPSPSMRQINMGMEAEVSFRSSVIQGAEFRIFSDGTVTLTPTDLPNDNGNFFSTIDIPARQHPDPGSSGYSGSVTQEQSTSTSAQSTPIATRNTTSPPGAESGHQRDQGDDPPDESTLCQQCYRNPAIINLLCKQCQPEDVLDDEDIRADTSDEVKHPDAFCSICQDLINLDEKAYERAVCNHLFHNSCWENIVFHKQVDNYLDTPKGTIIRLLHYLFSPTNTDNMENDQTPPESDIAEEMCRASIQDIEAEYANTPSPLIITGNFNPKLKPQCPICRAFLPISSPRWDKDSSTYTCKVTKRELSTAEPYVGAPMTFYLEDLDTTITVALGGKNSFWLYAHISKEEQEAQKEHGKETTHYRISYARGIKIYGVKHSPHDKDAQKETLLRMLTYHSVYEIMELENDEQATAPFESLNKAMIKTFEKKDQDPCSPDGVHFILPHPYSAAVNYPVGSISWCQPATQGDLASSGADSLVKAQAISSSQDSSSEDDIKWPESPSFHISITDEDGQVIAEQGGITFKKLQFSEGVFSDVAMADRELLDTDEHSAYKQAFLKHALKMKSKEAIYVRVKIED